MKRLSRGLLVVMLVGFGSTALADDRYVVGYATRADSGPGLTVVSTVMLEATNATEDRLRDDFAARLEGRKEKFLPDVAIFATRAEAEEFRKGLLERAAATGSVEQLQATVVEQASTLWRKHEKEFSQWPFSAAEAKKRQLRAAELWKLPLTTTVAGREFVLIPPGEFMMGSPADEAGRDADETQHRVRITAPYYLARDDEAFDTNGWGETLDTMFASAPAGWRFRLPTEAEWEYAARAGTAGRYPGDPGIIPAEHGAREEPLSWHVDGSWSFKKAALERGGVFLDYFASCAEPQVFGLKPKVPRACTNIRMTVPEASEQGLIGLLQLDSRRAPGKGRQFPPNAWGLFDTLGHFDEAVADTYVPYPSAPLTVDPRQQKDVYFIMRSGDFGQSPGKGFVMRGGHFFDRAPDMRVARRRQAGWTFLHYNYIAPNGLRLVLEKAEAAGKPSGVGDPVWRALEKFKNGQGKDDDESE